MSEMDIFEFTPDNQINLTFLQDGEEVGVFWYDKEAKEFKFKGDKAKSATEFVAWCLVSFREQLKALHQEFQEEQDDT